MRISDWSSDVCSSDLKPVVSLPVMLCCKCCCTPFTGGQTRNSSTGSMRHSPLSDFSAETRPVLIAFMSVWRVTPTVSVAYLRVIPMMSLAVKSACIVFIYRLHRQGDRRRARVSWFIGRSRVVPVPFVSPARGADVRGGEDMVPSHVGTVSRVCETQRGGGAE